MVSVRWMKWSISILTQLNGVYSCLSHFKLQFILDEILRWICDPSRINLRSLWNNYTGQLKSWSKIRLRSQDCRRLIGTSLCGDNHLYCVTELFIFSKIQNLRLCWVGAVSRRHQYCISPSLARQNLMVFGDTPTQRFGSNRRWPRRESRKCKEFTLEICRKTFQRLVRHKPLASAWSVSKIWGGCRQAYCTVELIKMPLPKSTSFPIRCCVWEEWETILLNPGRDKLNGIRTIVISKIWIESTGSRWNASGRFSQDSLQWEFSTRFKRWWRNKGVNLSNFKEGSSPCQCAMTLSGEHWKMKKIAWWNSLYVAAYANMFPQGCWSFLGPGCEKKWCGTHVSEPNGEWNKAAEVMMLTFAESGHPVFRATSEEN